MNNLTNDAKFLLSSMYAKYIERRKNGSSKDEATSFGDVQNVKEEIMPEWSFEDTRFTCFELRKHGYITGEPVDNQLWFIHLTTEAIAELEISFKDKLDSVLKFAADIKAAIPFL